ncbi:hypothetical protein ES706_04791 [subsurface metagenome]
MSRGIFIAGNRLPRVSPVTSRGISADTPRYEISHLHKVLPLPATIEESNPGKEPLSLGATPFALDKKLFRGHTIKGRYQKAFFWSKHPING